LNKKITFSNIEKFVLVALTTFTNKNDTLPPDTRKNTTEAFEPIGDHVLWEFSNRNRSASAVAHFLNTICPPSYSPRHWQKAHELSLLEISARVAEITRISLSLKEQNIPVVILENAAIAATGSYCLGCFKFGDLDFLYHPKHTEKLTLILMELGYTQSATHNGRIEFKGYCSDNIPIELNFQSCLVARRWFESSQEPEVTDLISRSMFIEKAGIRILQREDFLFQLITHSASHGYVRKPGVSLHLDIHRYLLINDINWNNFHNMVSKYKVKGFAYWSLYLPLELFNSPIPDEVMHKLRPPFYKRIILEKWFNKIGLFNPDERKFGKLGYIIFNCLLYDSLFDLLKGILPSRKWLKEHYKFESNLLLPYYYIKRIANLAFKRVI